MSYAPKVDGNQPEIARMLRLAGYKVQPLNRVKDGCPDLLVGAYGLNILLEIKDPSQPPNKRKLNEAEDEWHKGWPGQVAVVETADQAIKTVEEHAAKMGRGALVR